MQVHLAERGQKPVGVGHLVHPVGVLHLEPVVGEPGERQRDREQPGFDVLEHMTLTTDERDHLDRVWPVGADHRVVVVLVSTENRVRVVVLTGQQSVEVGGVRPQMRAARLGGLRHVLTPYAAN